MDKVVENLFKSNIDPSSVLGVLKRSLDSLHELRQSRKSSPCRLKISFSPGYHMVEKALSVLKDKGTVTASTSSQFSPMKQSIHSYLKSKNNLSTISRTQTPDPKRGLSYYKPSKLKAANVLESIVKKLNFNEDSVASPKHPNKNSALLSQALKEIKELNTSQSLMKEKIMQLNESLTKLSTAHVEEQSAMLSITNKLDTLESLASADQESKKHSIVPKVIEKISKLESNYSYLKSHNEDKTRNFREEMKEVNYKLQDLKECGEILKELVVCLGKEPGLSRKNVENKETVMDFDGFVKEETVLLEKIHPDNVLNELLSQKEELLSEKEKMENEYRNIPHFSKSMNNKRRKQALELELSLNYSKLMTVNNKIKRFAN